MTELLTLTAFDLRDDLARAIAAAGSQTAWARQHSIPVSQVCDTLRGQREPSESIINALGYSRVTRYVRMRRP